MEYEIISVEPSFRGNSLCAVVRMAVLTGEHVSNLKVVSRTDNFTFVAVSGEPQENVYSVTIEFINMRRFKRTVFDLVLNDAVISADFSLHPVLFLNFLRSRLLKPRVCALSGYNLLSSVDSCTVNIERNETLLHIDGWAMLDWNAVPRIEVDGLSEMVSVSRHERADVIEHYKGFPRDSEQGFLLTFVPSRVYKAVNLLFYANDEIAGVLHVKLPPYKVAQSALAKHSKQAGVPYLKTPEVPKVSETPEIPETPEAPLYEIIQVPGFHKSECFSFAIDSSQIFDLCGMYLLQLKGWARSDASFDQYEIDSGVLDSVGFHRFMRQDIMETYNEVGQDKEYGFIFWGICSSLDQLSRITFIHTEERKELAFPLDNLPIESTGNPYCCFSVQDCLGHLDTAICSVSKRLEITAWLYTGIENNPILVEAPNAKELEITTLTRTDLKAAHPQLENIESSGFVLNMLLESQMRHFSVMITRRDSVSAPRIYCFFNIEKMHEQTCEQLKYCQETNEVFEELKGSGSRDKLLESLYKNKLPVPSQDFVSRSDEHVSLLDSDVRYIAFYLPQYHPFPENDEFWGTGFTEWSNVTRAMPQFVGHYQPRLPADLGYYDLRLPEIQRQQAEMANQYGIYGMCYYYYWFDGRPIMDLPLKNLLANKDIPQRFCLSWANENWTRRWDGCEDDVLLAQNHSPEDDILFIESIMPALLDPRYIKVDGKPLLFLYRPGLFPDVGASIQRWREYCRENGVGELYIVGAMSFGYVPSVEDGFDAASEVQPHNLNSERISYLLEFTNLKFSGTVYDMGKYIRNREYLRHYSFPTHKCLVTEWDNTARRGHFGMIHYGNNPRLYRQWLEGITEYTQRNFTGEKRIVFINAWNEWCEGTYLEPDRKYGYAYLEATKQALLASRQFNMPVGGGLQLLAWGHDALNFGAQLTMLSIVKNLHTIFGIQVHLFLNTADGAELLSEYEKYAVVYDASSYDELQLMRFLRSLYEENGIKSCLTNTVISGRYLKLLKEAGYHVVSLIHEMKNHIERENASGFASDIAEYSDKIVFPAEIVARSFEEITALEASKKIICTQGSYKDLSRDVPVSEYRSMLRQRISAPADSFVVLGVGYVYERKGPDLFVKAARQLLSLRRDVYFVWVGEDRENYTEKCLEGVSEEDLRHIHFLGMDEQIAKYYWGSDIYWMTSREDPFPTVIMEAMLCALPCIGFEEAGGFTELIAEDTGALVPYLDCNAMAECTDHIFTDTARHTLLKNNCYKEAHGKFTYAPYVYRLLELLEHPFEKVSVIVPSYNYAKYLPARVKSIFDQTYPIYEVIILDDASTDDSREVIEALAKEYGDRVKRVFRETNSGNVFRQWVDGIKMVSGDYFWIAEADDLCHPRLVEKNINAILENDAVFAYCESCAIDENDDVVSESYREYNQQICPDKWNDDYVSTGEREIEENLAVRNSILNVSACLFKNFDVTQIEEQLTEFNVAGDWFLYLWLLENGKIAYNKDVLNIHRRHTSSVTKKLDAQKHYDEIVKMQELAKMKWRLSKRTLGKIRRYRQEAYMTLLGENADHADLS